MKTLHFLYAGLGALVGAAVLLGVQYGTTDLGDEPVPTPTVTQTETTTIDVVPEACAAALEDADDFRGIAQEMAFLVADHMTHDQEFFTRLVTGDISGVESYTVHLEEMNDTIVSLTERTEANNYAENRDECLRLAKEN